MKNLDGLKIVPVGLMLFCLACNAKQDKQVAERHAVEINSEGRGMIYADRTDCRTVLQEVDTVNSETVFHCFRIGFFDSLSVAKATDQSSLEEGRYYQYEMEHDWRILVNGDTVKPVFYQPRQKLQVQRNEGVMVFEVPKTKQIDTLLYNDSRGEWGTKKIIIN